MPCVESEGQERAHSRLFAQLPATESMHARPGESRGEISEEFVKPSAVRVQVNRVQVEPAG